MRALCWLRHVGAGFSSSFSLPNLPHPTHSSLNFSPLLPHYDLVQLYVRVTFCIAGAIGGKGDAQCCKAIFLTILNGTNCVNGLFFNSDT
jgi:hypothetical protein